MNARRSSWKREAPFAHGQLLRFPNVYLPVEISGRRDPSAYRPNWRGLIYLHWLDRRGDEEVRAFVQLAEGAFRAHYDLSKPAPRHDVMDHCLPLATPLNTSHVHEMFADLSKHFLLDHLNGQDTTHFPRQFFLETVEWRREYYNWDPSADLEYIMLLGPICYEAIGEFYRKVGKRLIRRIWDAGCKLHYEYRDLSYRDDYFSGTLIEDDDRCG